MSGYILCQIRQAENPLYVPEIDLHLYSIEELCYFCCENLPLLDAGFFSDSLTDWLDKELGMRRLSETIREEREKPFRLENVLMPVLSEISYLDNAEQQELTARIRLQDDLPEAARMKEKADTMLRNNRLALAADTYREILSGPSGETMGTQFIGTVWHNLGVVYARLFEMDEAVRCLKQAYEMLHSRTTMRDWLYSVWLAKGPEAYAKLADGIGVDARTRGEMDEELRSFHADTAAGADAEQLNGWVEDYHSATGL